MRKIFSKKAEGATPCGYIVTKAEGSLPWYAEDLSFMKESCRQRRVRLKRARNSIIILN